MISAAAVMHLVIGSLLVRAAEKARQGPRRDREDAAGLRLRAGRLHGQFR